MLSLRTIAALALFSALAAASTAAAPASAQTVEEVIAKHLAARGGKGWDAIRTLRITGSYTSFSRTEPFTLLRARDNRMRLEHHVVNDRALVGYDGQAGWQDTGSGAEVLRDLDLAMLVGDADFATPFLDYEKKGYQVKLIGESEFEGAPTIAIELERSVGLVETWHLDRGTYLEVGRLAPGTDWLGPVERRTYYEDFREFQGVLVPFYVESQWYTRERIMKIEKIEANVEIDDALFRMPAPLGMDVLGRIVGTWEVAVSTRDQPGSEWQESARRATVEPKLRGGLLEERWTTKEGVEALRSYSYDRFQSRHRLTQIDGNRSQMDVLEGAFDDSGRLVLSNVETGTTWNGWGMTFHTRLSIFDVTEDGFKLEHETSIDAGANWFLDAKATYTRVQE